MKLSIILLDSSNACIEMAGPGYIKITGSRAIAGADKIPITNASSCTLDCFDAQEERIQLNPNKANGPNNIAYGPKGMHLP